MELQNTNQIPTSPQYIRKILFDFGLRSYVAKCKPLLTKRMRSQRLRFAKKYINKTDEFWKKVIFSDESYIELNYNSIMNRIRRFKTTYPYNPTLCRPRIRHPIKIMVWGCFCSKGIGNLKICEGNMNSPKYVETLEHFLLPSIQRLELGEDAYHLDDSAPCHGTKKVHE